MGFLKYVEEDLFKIDNFADNMIKIVFSYVLCSMIAIGIIFLGEPEFNSFGIFIIGSIVVFFVGIIVYILNDLEGFFKYGLILAMLGIFHSKMFIWAGRFLGIFIVIYVWYLINPYIKKELNKI